MIVDSLDEWHRVVCERAGYVCYRCGISYNFSWCFNENGKNVYVCGDHIKTQGSRPDLRLETDNGRCVCFKCHEKRHRGQ